MGRVGTSPWFTVELRLGGNTTNMNFDQAHTQTHTNTHLQHTQTHTNTQLQHTDTRTCTFERQTRRCTSRTHVITDTQHARDITTHAEHNTYPPIALLPQPFSRIPKPSNMSQKHGTRFLGAVSLQSLLTSPRFMNSLPLSLCLCVGLGDPGLRTSAPRCLHVARDHHQECNLGFLLRGARRCHLCQNALLWEAVTCRRSSRKSLCSAIRQQ